jgi:hypothetical protein
MNCVDYMITLCWFQQIKQVTTLSSFAIITVMDVLNELGFTEPHLYSNQSNKGWNSSKSPFCFKYFQHIPKNQDQFEYYPTFIGLQTCIKSLQGYIAGPSKCSTKPLSLLLAKLLTPIKESLKKFCSTAYSRSGVSQMWILKNSKERLKIWTTLKNF